MRQIEGKHLLLDGYVASPEVLLPERLIEMFDKLVEVLGMQYLMRPTAVFVEPDKKKVNTEDDDGGWSVIAQITTSHIAIHTWPLRSAFMMDIFSCKHFDTERAKKLIFEHLDVRAATHHIVDRIGPAGKY